MRIKNLALKKFLELTKFWQQGVARPSSGLYGHIVLSVVTLFVVFDSEAVLQRSRCLILDPLAGHPDSNKRIDDHDVRETIKELAQLDGAFIVSNTGVVISACRYINASSQGIALPLGLGSRHMAAASITKETEAIAVVVSESSVVRVFEGESLSRKSYQSFGC